MPRVQNHSATARAAPKTRISCRRALAEDCIGDGGAGGPQGARSPRSGWRGCHLQLSGKACAAEAALRGVMRDGVRVGEAGTPASEAAVAADDHAAL